MQIMLPLTLPLLVAAGAAAAPSTLPSNVSLAGLLELSREGEVLFLPRLQASPFEAVIGTSSPKSCAEHEAALMDVDGYPRLWKDIKEVRVQKRAPKRIEYEFDIDLVFSPTIKGVVEHPSAGVVTFNDVETSGRFTYELRSVAGGCHILYHLYQPAGQKSGFVKLITTVEKGAADTGELIGALASLRGVASSPTGQKAALASSSESAERAWDQLAGAGTVLRLSPRPGDAAVVLTTKRRVSKNSDAVLWAIRDRKRYAKELDTVKKVKDRGRSVSWTFGYFGGRVKFDTAVTEEGDVAAPGGLVITERITSGDVDKGFWRWRVREVAGGTEVELHMDMDLTPGSLIMRNFVAKEPIIALGLPTQLALTMMGELIGGAPLPLARKDANVAKTR